MKGATYEGSLAKINKDFALCFEAAHRPASINLAERAIDSLSSLDLAIVLSIYRKLRNNAQKSRKVFYNFDNFRIVDYINTLSFAPTDSQAQAFEDIMSDMRSNEYMSRIISGDVGSGKTAVAFLRCVRRQKAENKPRLWHPPKYLQLNTQKVCECGKGNGYKICIAYEFMHAKREKERACRT